MPLVDRQHRHSLRGVADETAVSPDIHMMPPLWGPRDNFFISKELSLFLSSIFTRYEPVTTRYETATLRVKKLLGESAYKLDRRYETRPRQERYSWGALSKQTS
jgi:hypothetical protein